MKKWIASAVACGAGAIQVMATVSINLDALDLRTHDGSLAPLSTLCLMVVDVAGNGVTTNTLQPGFSLAVGSVFGGSGGDDIIVGRRDIRETSETEGWVSFFVTFPLEGGVQTGQRIGIIWLPHEDITSMTASPGWYGSYLDPEWLVPSDGATVGYYMMTESAGGSTPDSMGYAMYRIIPEPSTALLVGAGLLGLLAIRRRR